MAALTKHILQSGRDFKEAQLSNMLSFKQRDVDLNQWVVTLPATRLAVVAINLKLHLEFVALGCIGILVKYLHAHIVDALKGNAGLIRQHAAI